MPGPPEPNEAHRVSAALRLLEHETLVPRRFGLPYFNPFPDAGKIHEERLGQIFGTFRTESRRLRAVSGEIQLQDGRHVGHMIAPAAEGWGLVGLPVGGVEAAGPLYTMGGIPHVQAPPCRSKDIADRREYPDEIAFERIHGLN
jgi:hypothetical protein